MGTDNLHHKRKAKAKNELSRKKSLRSSYDKVLIVCEGEKTEPIYFNGLIKHYQLNSANVAIVGACGSSPKSVFEKAEELATQEERKGDKYDSIYCVFDKDSHSSYNETISKINKKQGFHAITSVPCFEYWILLHFIYTTKPFNGTHTKSISQEVYDELKKYFPDYEKSRKDLFSLLLPHIEFAKNNAQRANGVAKSMNTDNPTTSVDALVTYLQNIK